MQLRRSEAPQWFKEQSPAAFLEADRQKKGFVCPLCQNGTGPSGDGLRRVPRSSLYKCFRCGFHGDVLDLLRHTFCDILPSRFQRLAKGEARRCLESLRVDVEPCGIM